MIDLEADTTGHQYYRNNPIVRSDVLSVPRGLEDEAIEGRTYRPKDRYDRLG